MDILLASAAAIVIVVLAVALVIGVRRGFDDGYRRGIGPTRKRAKSGTWLSASHNSSYDSSDSSSSGSGGD
ncbi:hypothetical protein [Paractinoplanes atraurantiacus]|nr:hypothetical protein [Actinoplanes atraurantiacus]